MRSFGKRHLPSSSTIIVITWLTCLKMFLDARCLELSSFFQRRTLFQTVCNSKPLRCRFVLANMDSLNPRPRRGWLPPPPPNFSRSLQNPNQCGLRLLGNCSFIFCAHFEVKKLGGTTFIKMGFWKNI